MALKGPIVTQNADGSFKQPTGKTTLFPKLAKGKNLAQDDQPKTAKAKKSKAKRAEGMKPGPYTKTHGGVMKPKPKTAKPKARGLLHGLKPPKAAKPKSTKTRGPDKKNADPLNLANTRGGGMDQLKKPEKPTNGKAIGQRVLGLRAEMRTLEKKIKNADQHLKNMRKERREKITALWDLMDNTHQMDLPFA